jgi:hypothetical protein
MLVTFGGSEAGPVTKDTRNRGAQGVWVQLWACQVGMVVVARTQKISLMDIVDHFTGSVLCM